MAWYIPAQTGQLAIDAVLACIFLFLYRTDKKVYLSKWSSSWFIWALKYALEIVVFQRGDPPGLLSAGIVCCWLWAGFLFVEGMHIFLGLKLPRAWKPIVVVLCVGGAVAGVLKLSFGYLYMPATVWTGWMYIWTGARFLMASETEVRGKLFTGLAILLSGVHSADFPFLVQVGWLAPWGYLAAAVLKFTTANGTLLVYYQMVRANLSKSEATLQMIAENANDVILSYRVGPQGSINYVSPSVEKLTGFSVREFEEDPRLLLRHIHPDDQQLLKELLSNEGDRARVRFRWLHKQQAAIVWVELQAKLIKDETSRLTVIEGIAWDVTQQKTQEDELVQLHKARKELFSDISHELRTPIATIQGYAEAILDGVVTESAEVQVYLQTIHSRAVRINRLIKDLLNIARLENRQISFTLTPMGINKLIHSIYDRNSLDVQTAGLSFELEVSPAVQDAGLVVNVDMDRIDQVFANIIDNAIKHTPTEQSIRLKADLLNGGKTLLVGVADSGSGIASEDLPLVFNRFYRAKATDRKSVV